jgi:hypothetical protein
MAPIQTVWLAHDYQVHTPKARDRCCSRIKLMGEVVLFKSEMPRRSNSSQTITFMQAALYVHCNVIIRL